MRGGKERGDVGVEGDEEVGAGREGLHKGGCGLAFQRKGEWDVDES